MAQFDVIKYVNNKWQTGMSIYNRFQKANPEIPIQDNSFRRNLMRLADFGFLEKRQVIVKHPISGINSLAYEYKLKSKKNRLKVIR